MDTWLGLIFGVPLIILVVGGILNFFRGTRKVARQLILGRFVNFRLYLAFRFFSSLGRWLSTSWLRFLDLLVATYAALWASYIALVSLYIDRHPGSHTKVDPLDLGGILGSDLVHFLETRQALLLLLATIALAVTRQIIIRVGQHRTIRKQRAGLEIPKDIAHLYEQVFRLDTYELPVTRRELIDALRHITKTASDVFSRATDHAKVEGAVLLLFDSDNGVTTLSQTGIVSTPGRFEAALNAAKTMDARSAVSRCLSGGDLVIEDIKKHRWLRPDKGYLLTVDGFENERHGSIYLHRLKHQDLAIGMLIIKMDLPYGLVQANQGVYQSICEAICFPITMSLSTDRRFDPEKVKRLNTLLCNSMTHVVPPAESHANGHTTTMVPTDDYQEASND